jgi:hypothetical protein
MTADRLCSALNDNVRLVGRRPNGSVGEPGAPPATGGAGSTAPSVTSTAAKSVQAAIDGEHLAVIHSEAGPASRTVHSARPSGTPRRPSGMRARSCSLMAAAYSRDSPIMPVRAPDSVGRRCDGVHPYAERPRISWQSNSGFSPSIASTISRMLMSFGLLASALRLDRSQSAERHVYRSR